MLVLYAQHSINTHSFVCIYIYIYRHTYIYIYIYTHTQFIRIELGRILSTTSAEGATEEEDIGPTDKLARELLAMRCANEALSERINTLHKRCDTLRKQTAVQKESTRRAEQRLVDATDELCELRRKTPLPDGVPSLEHILALLDEREAALLAARTEARFEATQCEQAREEASEHASQRDAAEARERECLRALANSREDAAKELAVQRDLVMQDLRRADIETSARCEGAEMLCVCVYICVCVRGDSMHVVEEDVLVYLYVLCAYERIYVRMNACENLSYLCLYHVSVHVCMYFSIYIYIYIYIYMSVSACIHAYKYLYIYIYICMYVCIYI